MGFRGRSRGGFLTVILVLLTIFLGNRLGELAAVSVPVLGKAASLALGPATLDVFGFVALHGGFALRVNAVGALVGLVGWFLLTRRS